MKYIEQYDCYVDSDGVIYWRDNSGKLHQPYWNTSPSGYVRVRIKGRTVLVHRVYALAFVPNDDPKTKTQVDHINRIKSDNRFGVDGNLRWVTASENQLNTRHSDACFDMYGLHQCDDDAAYQRAKYGMKKEAHKEYNRRNYLKHREARLEYQKQYREAHK